jgi:NAD(P)-dependent dehydrogenase (short-subunit alcohol dehydrogenase family)
MKNTPETPAKLTGKTAVVTGAGSGIGRAIAGALSAAGANIVIADLHHADATAQSLRNNGAHAVGITADIASETGSLALAETAQREFGGADILVNNAAIFSSLIPKPFEEISAEEWRRVMEVNTLGPFLCCKALLPLLKQSNAARIINISSGVAFKGNPLYLHYVASKGAVLSMTRSLARELGAYGILVNGIAPGFTLSEGVQANAALVAGARGPSLAGRVLNRDMYPDDLLGAAVFFAGPDAGFITGQTLVIDGGAYFH